MKVLKKFEFKERTSSKYPWDKLFDGNTYEINKGTDYECSTRNMSGKVRSAARKKFKKLKVSVNEKENKIILQARDMTPEEKAIETTSRTTSKAARKEKKTAKKTGTNPTPAAGQTAPAPNGSDAPAPATV